MRTNTILLTLVALLVLALLAGGAFLLLSDVPPVTDGPGDGPRGSVGPDDDGTGGGADAPSDPIGEDPESSGGGDGGLPPPGRREGTVVRPPPADGAWLAIAPYEAFLARLDWDFIGSTYAALVPNLNDRANSAYRGDPEGDRQAEPENELYGRLIEMELEHTDVFGVQPPYRLMLHPAVMSNSIAATLYARRRGLTEEQLELLRDVATRHTAEEVRLREEPTPGDEPVVQYAIEKDAALARRLRTFFREVEAILDAEQRELLHSDIARERRWLDAFSAANVWLQPVLHVQYLEPEEIPMLLKARVMGGLDHRQRPQLEQAIDRIAARLPAERLRRRHRLMDLMGFVRLDDLLLGCELSAEMARAHAAVVLDDPRLAVAPGDIDTPFVLLRDPGE